MGEKVLSIVLLFRCGGGVTFSSSSIPYFYGITHIFSIRYEQFIHLQCA